MREPRGGFALVWYKPNGAQRSEALTSERSERGAAIVLDFFRKGSKVFDVSFLRNY